jgi:hypothetical protein
MFHDGLIPGDPYHANSAAVATIANVTEITGTTGGWAYDSVNGRVWINDTNYTSY